MKIGILSSFCESTDHNAVEVCWELQKDYPEIIEWVVENFQKISQEGSLLNIYAPTFPVVEILQ